MMPYKTKRRGLWALVLFVAVSLFPSALKAQEEVAAPSVFLDVSKSHAYYVPILFLKHENVFQGYPDGTFLSEKVLNKAESLKVIFASADIQSQAAFQAGLFPDVAEDDWFSTYVMQAHALGFVKGNDADGAFAGNQSVSLAVFLKMMLEAHEVDVSAFEGRTVVPNIDPNVWYAKYVNYAVSFGLISTDEAGEVDPSHQMTRGEVAEVLYLLMVLQNGADSQFLLDQSELHLTQIEIYLADKQVSSAKRASQLAVDLTQQAYKNDPKNMVILGAAKIARAYDLMVDTYILAVQGEAGEVVEKARQATLKATEAWEVNKDTQVMARHIKDRVLEIVAQVDEAAVAELENL